MTDEIIEGLLSLNSKKCPADEKDISRKASERDRTASSIKDARVAQKLDDNNEENKEILTKMNIATAQNEK